MKAKFPTSYAVYRRAVDAAVEAKVGLSLDDLPDVLLDDWFEDRVPVGAAASRAIRYAKEF